LLETPPRDPAREHLECEPDKGTKGAAITSAKGQYHEEAQYHDEEKDVDATRSTAKTRRRGWRRPDPYVVCHSCGNWCYEHKLKEVCVKCRTQWPSHGPDPGAQPDELAEKALTEEDKAKLSCIIGECRQMGIPTEKYEKMLRPARLSA